MTKRKVQYWVIPPEQNGEFVAAMENVLETYHLPYDPEVPVVVMDEQPVQPPGLGPNNILYSHNRWEGWHRVAVREFKTKTF